MINSSPRVRLGSDGGFPIALRNSSPRVRLGSNGGSQKSPIWGPPRALINSSPRIRLGSDGGSRKSPIWGSPQSLDKPDLGLNGRTQNGRTLDKPISMCRGASGGVSDVYVFFLYVCATTNCLVRFLRVHPVQSVINSPTQLSGRGFPGIFYIKLCLSQLYVFVCAPKLKLGRVNITI